MEAKQVAGFIGGGFMAAVHSRAARVAGAKLQAIASSSLESASRAAENYGIAKAVSVSELVSDPEITVVHICSPNSTHYEYALAALEAGKNVICEKPLAVSLSQSQELSQIAADKNLIATVPFIYRYHPMVREAKHLVASGATGTVFTISGSYLQDWLLEPSDDNWRVESKSGGPSRAFADIGSHLVDLIEFVSEDRITRLSATKKTFFANRKTSKNVETEDSVALIFETAKGAIGNLLVSQLAPGHKNQLLIELSGSQSSIRFEQENPETLWLGQRAKSEILSRESSYLSSEAARLSLVPSGHPMGYQDAFNAFIADSYSLIRRESVIDVPLFSDGLRAVELTEAVLESAEKNSWVEVQSVLSATRVAGVS